MPLLTDLPELIGFFSYSREDDEDSHGELSALRSRIQGELRGQLGRTAKTFRLWQDKEAIASGSLWETEIKNAVAQAVFFIPIITPTVIASPYCRFELESFLAREVVLGRDDLVFPILYIEVPALEDATRRQNDPILSLIARRQYVDWSEYRYLEVDSTEVRRAVGRFCADIRNSLYRPWISPEEREQQERAAVLAKEQAERERRESEVKRRADEEEQQRRTAEEERRQREAEAERMRAESEQKAARERQEQAERDRQAQAERERQVQAERERQAQAERERLEADAKRRAEEEAQKKSEEERQKHEEAERTRIAALEAKARDEAEAKRRAEVEDGGELQRLPPPPPQPPSRRVLVASIVGVAVVAAVGGWFVVSPMLTGPTALTATQEQALKPMDTFQECSKCPVMKVVAAGSFFMGSPTNEPGRDSDESPQHTVTIPGQLAVGQYEVTFDQWNACVADGGCNAYKPPDQGWSGGQLPVINVSWDDATAYVTWLAKKTGQPYRLLSEAEYEYAARAGSTTAYPWGDAIGKNNANCDGCGSQWDDKQTAPVGSFAANAFGLYDMAGNVWEWTQDCYHGSYDGAPTDGSAWVKGGDCSSRLLRGGSWDNYPRFVRSAVRDGLSSNLRNNDFGFRVGRTLLLAP